MVKKHNKKPHKNMQKKPQKPNQNPEYFKKSVWLRFLTKFYKFFKREKPHLHSTDKVHS